MIKTKKVNSKCWVILEDNCPKRQEQTEKFLKMKSILDSNGNPIQRNKNVRRRPEKRIKYEPSFDKKDLIAYGFPQGQTFGSANSAERKKLHYIKIAYDLLVERPDGIKTFEFIRLFLEKTQTNIELRTVTNILAYLTTEGYVTKTPNTDPDWNYSRYIIKWNYKK